jgi:hypothetical protein
MQSASRCLLPDLADSRSLCRGTAAARPSGLMTCCRPCCGSVALGVTALQPLCCGRGQCRPHGHALRQDRHDARPGWMTQDLRGDRRDPVAELIGANRHIAPALLCEPALQHSMPAMAECVDDDRHVSLAKCRRQFSVDAADPVNTVARTGRPAGRPIGRDMHGLKAQGFIGCHACSKLRLLNIRYFLPEMTVSNRPDSTGKGRINRPSPTQQESYP